MIKKAAAGYVGWLCANGIVAPEKNKIYAYGMELVGQCPVCPADFNSDLPSG
jgi:hypothetical protein